MYFITGQSELFKVLKAYTVYNPSEGYCQAHAPIAASLLMSMPAEEAFWCLVCICENYIQNVRRHEFGLKNVKNSNGVGAERGTCKVGETKMR